MKSTLLSLPGARPKTIQPITGVKVEPAPHGAKSISTDHSITTAKDLLKSSCNKEFEKIRNNNLIQSSFTNINTDTPAFAARNGFVDSALLAYNEHHHLIIRPEDVWFSILVQLNAYINAHAEELRSMFVAHEGQKKLVLEADGLIAGTSQFGVDWAKFAYQIGKKIEENILDPSLRKWFLPAFSTTTKSDQATASIIMMLWIASVTLLGTKADWGKMLDRLERLKTFGDETTVWYGLLKPVLKRFVQTFDDPDSEEVKDFWQKIAHYSGGGSGPTYLSGWITAFCYWDENGKCFRREGHNPPDGAEMESMGRPTPILVLDEARYHRIETSDVPPGYAAVPVEIDDNGDITNARMVAGSVGMRPSSSGLKIDGEGEAQTGTDTVQPGSGWWMYEIMSEEETLEEARKKYEVMRARYPQIYPEWNGKESLSWLE